MPEQLSHRWKNIMKAYPFSEERLAKWQPPYLVQPKYDGVRCRAIPIESPTTEGCILLSSEENVIHSVPHLNKIIGGLGLNSELDGELYCHGMSFEQIISITSRTVNLHPDYKRIQFHCFDIVNDQPQMKRSLIIENLRGLNPHIVVAPFWICQNLDDVMRTYDRLMGLGYEGIIVRHMQAPYELKRSLYVMKFKAKKEDDYEIFGTVEEVDKEGSPKDSLGALICKSGDGNLFNVGTGFTADRRRELWAIRDSLPGSTAKVKYQHLTTGKQVPRFPVFVEVVKKSEKAATFEGVKDRE
jgi:DNA ligase-1